MMHAHMKPPAFAEFFAPVLDGLYRAGQEAYKSTLLMHVNRSRSELGRPPVAWPSVGTTPHEVLWQQGSARLLRYRAPSAKSAVAATPILAVCSLINRPYVLDLLPERSVVRRLLDGGRDVWLLDWGAPLFGDEQRDLASYALDVLGGAVDEVRRVTGAEAIDVLGYCMGATLALLSAGAGRVPLRSLVAMAAPVRFDDGGMLSTWARVPSFDPRQVVAVYGNAPPHLLQPAFKMLDPAGLATKLVHLDDKLGDDAFVRFFLAMETWLEDSVAFPGGAFVDWISLYRDDALVGGKARLGRHRVSVASVEAPILNLIAEGDYITPPASSLALAEACPRAAIEVRRVPGGHIGLATSSYAQRTLWPEVAAWLARLDAPPARATRPRPRTKRSK